MDYFKGISHHDLLIRYANNYGLERERLTIEMVLKHWELEKELTRELLSSTRETRKSVFYHAYNVLYKELPWLQDTGSLSAKMSEDTYHKRWKSLLGEIAGKRIYEIGSGNGELINMLAQEGAICVATELSEHRSDKVQGPNLQWHATDGVNLTGFEPASYYDLILSDQVIEHLHPDDISTHFKNVYDILKPGGKYLFYTPHFYIGPGDVSRIFYCMQAEGMHLKEYKYAELHRLLKAAGFGHLAIPVYMVSGTRLLKNLPAFLLLERSLTLAGTLGLRKRLYHRLVKFFKLSQEIVMIAHK